MQNFYHAIDEVNPNHLNLAVTVLEGESFGEKALISNHEIIWKSENSGYFIRNQAELKQIQDGGVYTIDNQTVFCELLGQEKKMVICGGGHVSIPIVKMGLMIGCHVTVLEDRPKFADNARRAGATEVICEPFAQGLEKVEGDKDTFFIIVTRGHRYDQACLERIARKEHAYIGMIGSKKRVAKVKEAVIEGGADSDVVNRVYTPIGLDIGAETPEEIAVAVLAEVIEVKNKKKRNSGYPKEILKEIFASEDTPKVLVTIVTRKGSAPREAGAKMLVMPDGTCFGSIGGGCAESDILQKALWMLHEDDRDPQLHHVDLTGKDAEEEGMVCGGIINVLLEVI